MEENFLENWIKKIDPNSKLGSHAGEIEPWYNPPGDCIQFQTVNEAVVAQRVDNYLTIYHSAINNDPIGFKIKDVRRLLERYECEDIQVSGSITGHRIVHVSRILLRAYESEPITIGRRTGYASAFDALAVSQERQRVAIPLEAYSR